MRQQIIFLNGPPRAGKDSLARRFVQLNRGWRVVKFAEVLKIRTHALYGMGNTSADLFEKVKDVPMAEFLGVTPRQAYIGVSEKLLKPLHGEEIFGSLLLNHLMADRYAKGFVISDSGFASEAAPLIRHFGKENCLLVRIHADSRGCSFDNDSRSYLDLGIGTLDLHNDDSEERFLKEATECLRVVLQQRNGGR